MYVGDRVKWINVGVSVGLNDESDVDGDSDSDDDSDGGMCTVHFDSVVVCYRQYLASVLREFNHSYILVYARSPA